MKVKKHIRDLAKAERLAVVRLTINGDNCDEKDAMFIEATFPMAWKAASDLYDRMQAHVLELRAKLAARQE